MYGSLLLNKGLVIKAHTYCKETIQSSKTEIHCKNDSQPHKKVFKGSDYCLWLLLWSLVSNVMVWVVLHLIDIFKLNAHFFIMHVLSHNLLDFNHLYIQLCLA